MRSLHGLHLIHRATRSLIPLGIALVACCLWQSGCTKSDAQTSEPQTILIDTRTHEVFVAHGAVAVPAENPESAEPTLMPAMYCPSCGSWHPTPPAEELQRRPDARKCPKTLALLVPVGPLPDGVREIGTPAQNH